MENRERQIITALAESLDVPDSAYELASNRYQDLGNWLCSDKSKSSKFAPRVIPQGSFRLGTVTRPWKNEDYDLDLACKFEQGITKENFSQSDLKELLGKDLADYRNERKILSPLEKKHRCWRLNYQDSLSFHIDITPCIPLHHDSEITLSNLDINAVSITDDRRSDYQKISSDWLVSNPEGYARWFESRMKQSQVFLSQKAAAEHVSSIDDLPAYRWKTPLQKTIQILKRHRDIMFEKAPESKPISIIITTLAAQAYNGEADIYAAIKNVLNNMEALLKASHGVILNPVNPNENFSDRWNTYEGKKLALEQNFWGWLEQAKSDIDTLVSCNLQEITSQAEFKFGTKVEPHFIGEDKVTTLKVHNLPSTTAKPWANV